jgi:hypothetical protein
MPPKNPEPPVIRKCKIQKIEFKMNDSTSLLLLGFFYMRLSRKAKNLMAKKFTKKPTPKAMIFPGIGWIRNISTAMIITRRLVISPRRLERKCFMHRCRIFPFLEKTNVFARAKFVSVPNAKAKMTTIE